MCYPGLKGARGCAGPEIVEYDFLFSTVKNSLKARGIHFKNVSEFSLKRVDGKWLVTVINGDVCRFEL